MEMFLIRLIHLKSIKNISYITLEKTVPNQDTKEISLSSKKENE